MKGDTKVDTFLDGDCLQAKRKNNFFDEVVIEQESQIAPVYLIKVQKKGLRQTMDDWSQSVAERSKFSGSLPVQPEAGGGSVSGAGDDMMIPLLDMSTAQ